MLRNKLSKLIVSIMAAVMITGAGFGGQAVKATTVQTQGQAQQGQTIGVGNQAQTKTIFNVTATTTQQQIQDAIKDTNTDTITIGTNITFSVGVINELNSRTIPLTIEVTTGGSINLPTGTSLDGKGNLIISRGTGVTDTLITVEGDVSISNVKFQNKQGVIIKDNAKTPANKLNLTGNIVDAGQFIDSSLFNKTTATGNTIAPGATLAGTSIVFGNSVIGTTEITVNGTAAGITGDISIAVQETGTTNVVNIAATIGADGKFTAKIPNLKPNTSYTFTIQYTDNGATKTVTKTEKTNNIEFKTSVTNITTTSASINITANAVPADKTVEIAVRDSNGNNLAGYNKEVKFNNTFNATEVVTGLTPNTKYSYELIYTVQGQNSISVKGDFITSNSSLVTGGGNNGSSTIVTPQITSNDISRSTIKDVTATLEVSNNTAYNSLRDAREITTNIKGVTAEFVNGKLKLNGLVPEKEYTNLEITYINRDGRKGTIKVAKFTTKKSETKIRQFVTDVYRYALDRLADEEGFAYWVTGIEKKTITPDTLVKNLLNEKEFIEKHKTTEDKINGLYQVIVNRKSDAEGLKFWTNKYDVLIKTGYSDAMALRILVDQMVNEQEFKNRVKDLGL